MSTAVQRPRKPRAPRSLESQVMRGIIDYLHHDPRVLVWRNNTGGMRLTGRDGSRRFVKFGIQGQADITGVVRATGQRIEIEVKRPGEKQRDAQVIFMNMLRGAGALYFLVTSIGEVQAALEQALGPRWPR